MLKAAPKTPAAPSKATKRGSGLFKKGSGGTAPNTPEEDDKAGVTVMAKEYDPSQDVAALTGSGGKTKTPVPSSPLRKDAKPIDLVEEKKESEDDVGAAEAPSAEAPQAEAAAEAAKATATGAGVDVVSKILANFDDICAVPKDPKQVSQAASIASSKSGSGGKKEEFTQPEWGLVPSMTMDGDETTTNPSISLPSESSDPYSSAYTNSTSQMPGGQERRGIIKKSPSQDHENFEVVLDPTSLLSDDEDDQPAAPKKKRWPFKKSSKPSKAAVAKAVASKSTGVNEKKATELKQIPETPAEPTQAVEKKATELKKVPEEKPVELTAPEQKEAVVEPKKAPETPPPITEEVKDEKVEETPDPLIPAVTPPVPLEEGVEQKEEVQVEAKKPEPKKSLVKRSWKSAKKLISKAGSGTSTSTSTTTVKEPKQQHLAEVDTEAQNALSLEEQEGFVAAVESLKTGVDQPIEEEKNEDVEKAPVEVENNDEAPGSESTPTVWNSIVASIAGTFDPEVAAEAAAKSMEQPTEAENSPEQERSLEDTTNAMNESQEAGTPVEVTAGPERKEKPKPRSSFGLKGLKSITKSAKNLVKAPKKEGAPKPQATRSAPVKQSTPAKAAATVPARNDKDAPQRKTNALWKAAPAKSSAPDKTASATTPSSSAEAVPQRKPKASWKAVEDKSSGKTYYYHRKTRETTWEKPKEYEQYEVALRKWKASHQNDSSKVDAKDKASANEEGAEKKTQEERRSGSPRSSSWPSSSPKSDAEEKKESAEKQRAVTPPAVPSDSGRDVILTASPVAQKPTSKDVDIVSKKEGNNWERRKEVERLLKSLPPDDSRKSLDELMTEYSGKEGVLVKQLRAKVEKLPVDEARPFDEPVNMEERKKTAPMPSPHRFGQRTMTYMSKASATTRSSALTDRTEKIKNTGKGKSSPFVPINENLSSATSISSHNDSDKYHSSGGAVPAQRVPSRVPVPRERQLMVEELTDSRVSAESYEGNGGKRGRIVRGRAREPKHHQFLDTVYDGDNDDNTDDDNTASLYDNDTYGTDSVSALSENDTDFIHRKDNFEQARRRALDDAIEREDWDLAAALSEGMRAANMPGGYERAHTSWNQSELDKFIANNDWSAVKSYIARMREKSQTSANKSIGARSQLQHKELMSESSWTSDSQSSYESYDSESEI
ncbi:MAG: hypothetical protein SGILL_005666 [Bacillariaceae sp.]